MGLGSERWAAALAARLTELIQSEPSSIQPMLLAFFSQPGKTLGDGARHHWARLTARSFEVAGARDPLLILDESIAVELLIGAFDILDDFEDEEIQPWMTTFAAGRVLNVSTLMTVRGFTLLGDTSNDPIIDARKLPMLLRTFRHLRTVGAGQDLDLAAADQGAIADSTKIMETLVMRSGTLGRAAAEIGAALGTDTPPTIDRLGDFGQCVTLYGQLINDVHDVEPRDHKRGDRVAGKLSYPIAVASGLTGKPPGELTAADIEESGALVAGWARARSLIAEARAIAGELGAHDQLDEFLPAAGT